MTLRRHHQDVDDAGVSQISDIGGLTGMLILDAILKGERDRCKLAALGDPRIKASKEEIAKSLEGNWRPDLSFVLRQQRDLYREYQKRIRECDEAMQAHLKTLQDKTQPGKRPEVSQTRQTHRWQRAAV